MGQADITERERQILDWIRQDPMISQEELAGRAGIARSSVAVHISNLMKKGLIKGKGYVLSQSDYVAVVGGVNVDIGGIPFEKPVARDSNPGRVHISMGGVGRNIAHNLSLLGVNVKFLTAFGTDENGRRVELSCRELGIDITDAKRVTELPTSTYLYICDEQGDMELALSDMEAADRITPGYISEHLSVLRGAKAVVIDANIPEETIAFIAENVDVPIFADPVSTAKAGKFKNSLGRLHTLKPNLIEAELLTGIKITGTDSLEKAAEKLLSTGLKRVFISLGEKGVLAADETGMRIITSIPADMKNATGAGDAFTAALVWAFTEGEDTVMSGRLAHAAAAMAVESSETINENITAERVRARLK